MARGRFLRITATLLLFTLIAFSLAATLSVPSAHAAAPTLSMGGWKDGQTKVIVEFDQSVDNGSDGALDASDFAVAGANAISITSVEHFPFSHQAILTLSGNLNSAGGTDFTIACASNAVFNPADEACGAGTVNVYTAISEDTTGPSVEDVGIISGTTVFVDFNEIMDPDTLTAGNFTLTTSDGDDDSSITSTLAFDHGVDLVAGGATIAAGAGNTVQVSSSVTDIFGNASAGETVAIYPPIKISEIQAATSTNSKNEFIELYNYGPAPIDLSDIKLHLWSETLSSDFYIPLTMFETSIPANGFYLIAPAQFSHASGVLPDATYDASSGHIGDNGSVYISYSTTADVGVIDLAAVGTSSKKEGTAAANITAGQSLERKANFGSSVASMADDGADELKGNAFDDGDNATDFVVQTTPNPQNSFSPTEFAFGASFNEGGDTSAPTVVDSFPSAASANFIPAFLDMAGIDFSEPLDASTVNTTNVKLVLDSDPGTNLCNTVTYDDAASFGPDVSCSIDAGSLPLANAAHTLTVTTGVTDITGNALASNYTVSFTPQSGQTFGSQSVPFVVGTFPSQGSSSFPPDAEFIEVNFDGSLDVSTVNTTNVTLTNTTTSSAVAGIAVGTRTVVDANDAVAVNLSGATITAGNSYRLDISTSVTSAEGIAVAPFMLEFTAADSNDVTGPVVIGTGPPNGETGLPVGFPVAFISFDDALDASTVDANSVKLLQGSDELAATVTYHSAFREVEIEGAAAFLPNTTYTVQLAAASSGDEIKNVSGVALQDTDGTGDNYYKFSFTTGAADSSAPDISFSTATQNKVTVTFTEPMREGSVTNLANWSLESPIGTSVPLSALAGGTVSWDAGSLTAEISGISLTAGATFEITASTAMKDMSGNALASSTTVGGTVLDSATFGESLGPDAGFNGEIFDFPPAFDEGDWGHVPQAGVWPMTGMAGATSNYMVNFPITEQIRGNANGGKVVLTFPSGFNVTNAAVLSDSFINKDVNVHGSGTVAINSVTANNQARTVTVDFSIATACGSGNVDPCVSGDENDFISFDLEGIGNTDQPRDWETSGYTVDIKTMTGSTVNETMTSMPFFISPAGDNSLQVDLTAAGADTGTADVHIWSPGTGEMTATANFATNGDGTASVTFSGLPSDYFDIWMDPVLTIKASDDFVGPMNEPVFVTGSTTKAITLSATSGLTSVTVNVTGATGKDIDVFAGGPNGFTVKRISSTTGSDSVTLKLADGDWHVGVGPHMSMDGGFTMPEPPDYIVSPGNLNLSVASPNVTEDSGTANDGTVTFDLSPASDSVTVNVVDESGNPVMDAMIFMDSTEGGFGTFGQTSGAGSATLNVNPGTYRAGAFLDGTPPTREIRVRVADDGSVYQDGTLVNAVTIELSKGDYAISGTVTDGNNAVTGAAVHAFCTANCEGYFDAGAMTNSNGKYTLYVGAGTWQVEAFIPGFGSSTRSTVVITTDDETGVNLSPDSDVTFRTISGTVCKKDGGGADCTGGTGIDGIEIFAWSDANGGGSNFTQTGADGTFSLRVPSASGYTLEAWDPRKGPLPIISNVDVSSGNQTDQDIVIDTPEGVTINLKDDQGNAVTVGEVFIEFFDDSTEVRQHVFIENDSDGTIDLPEGVYDVLVHAKGVELDESTDVTSDDAGTSVTSGVVTVDGTEVVKIEIPDLQTISGTLTDGSDPVEDAWVEVTDPTTGISTGGVTDSNGNYSISVPDGTYQVNAYNPGLVVAPMTVAVSGASATDQDMEGTVSSQNITGTVTDPSGNAVPYAFVEASKSGGGFTAVQADADGEYSLPVDDGTWQVTAIGHGYESEALGSNVVISGSSDSGNDIQFDTSASGLAEPTVKSVTPADGGTVQDQTAGLTVSIPANATSTSTSAGTVSMKETNNVVSTANNTVVGEGFEISMTDAGGTALSSGFDEEVSIKKNMSVADLDTAGIDTLDEVKDLKISYFSGNGTWIPENTTKAYLDADGDVVASPAADLSNVTTVAFTTAVDHFTVFSITAPADGLAPKAPTNVSASVDGMKVTITWDAVTTNSDDTAITDLLGYEIYRDTDSGGAFSTQLNTSDILTTSYSDSTVEGSTTYYYKVTAADTGGQESAMSSAATAVVVGSTTSSSGGRSSTPSVQEDDDSDDVTEDAETTEEETVSIDPEDPVAELYPDKTETEAALPSSVNIGSLVKLADSPAVYFVGGDGTRHPFANAHIYFTWYDNFDDVETISADDMANIPMGEAVRVRPGTWLVKIQSDPKVYAVEPGGALRWIETEEVALTLYGTNWNRRIIDVEPIYFTRYEIGDPISEAKIHPEGSIIRDIATGDVYYVAEDGTLRKFIDDEAVQANEIQTQYVLNATTKDLERTIGDPITSREDILLFYQDIGR